MGVKLFRPLAEHRDGAIAVAERRFFPVGLVLPDGTIFQKLFCYFIGKSFGNGGFSAMLLCFLFLFFAAWGAGPYSLDARRAGTDFKA